MEVFVRHLTTSLGYLTVSSNPLLFQKVKLVFGNRRVQRADTRILCRLNSKLAVAKNPLNGLFVFKNRGFHNISS